MIRAGRWSALRSRRRALGLCAPSQINNLAVRHMGLVHAPQLQAHALRSQCGPDPTGGVAFVKYVSHRWQVDEVNAAAVLLDFPGMRMAVDVGLYLPARPDGLEQGRCIFESQVATKPGIVMN